MENRKERIQWFDYCKGILIIFVVLGHVMPEQDTFHSWIYSWHMPAFFVLNGMLLSYTRYETRSILGGGQGVLIQGIRKLIIPYYVYGCLLLIARWWNSGFELSNLQWQIMDLGLFCGIGATWFLPCLFFAQLIYFGVKKISYKIIPNNLRLQYSLVGILAVGILCVPFLIDHRNSIELVIFRSLIGAFFCIVGDLFWPCIVRLRNVEVIWKICLVILLASMSCGVFIATGKKDISLNVLKLDLPEVYVLNALIGTLLVIVAAMVFEEKFHIISLMLEFYGKNSLIVMGTHQVIMMICNIPVIQGYLWNLVCCVVVLLVEIPVIIFVKKMRIVKKRGK